MKTLQFTIPGDPVSQGRPRFSTHGGFARAYDPKKSREGKAVVRLCASEALREALDGANLYPAPLKC